ncbi:MAG: hypothetical protein OK474_06870 [Thaumarchaeota archaeon]|nr:hypothetical protein [Nitrososphaerota archaeon]
MRKIELPSEELAEELQSHLQDKRFTGSTYDKGRRTIQFPDNMNTLQWSSLRGTVEKWAKGRHLEVVESLKLQSTRSEETQVRADPKELEAEVKKKLERLTPETAEERYKYLQSRPISELTEAEFNERLALAQRSDKVKPPKK